MLPLPMRNLFKEIFGCKGFMGTNLACVLRDPRIFQRGLGFLVSVRPKNMRIAREILKMS